MPIQQQDIDALKQLIAKYENFKEEDIPHLFTAIYCPFCQIYLKYGCDMCPNYQHGCGALHEASFLNLKAKNQKYEFAYNLFYVIYRDRRHKKGLQKATAEVIATAHKRADALKLILQEWEGELS